MLKMGLLLNFMAHNPEFFKDDVKNFRIIKVQKINFFHHSCHYNSCITTLGLLAFEHRI